MAVATFAPKSGVLARLRYGVPWRAVLIHVASILIMLWIVLPFAWVVLTSLMTEAESLSVPPHWIPDYITFDNYLGLLDTLLALILSYLTFTVPYSVWIMASYFRTIPRELEDAARVDRCNWINMMVRVFLPVASPGLIACAMFAFMSSWGEFLYALLFTSSLNSKTMPIIIAGFVTDTTTSPTLMNAGGVLAVLPPLVLALIFQRLIVSGIT